MTDHAKRLRTMAAEQRERADRAPMADTLARCQAEALEAGAEALKRAAWRPISEAHEDFGDLILININDPGDVRLSHICALGWDEDSEGMTHFAQIPALTQKRDDELRGTE